MRYPSKKGALFIIPIAVMLLLAVISVAYSVPVIIQILLFAVIALMLWMWFDTYYIIEDGQLFYKCAFIKGSIDIATIHEIVKNKKICSGDKPALSTKGFTIKYNKWDDIYISPKDEEQFINALKEINPDIQVSE